MKRRDFLKHSTLALTAASLPTAIFRKAHALEPLLLADSAPQRILDSKILGTPDFTGDEFLHPHEVLWDPKGYLAKKGGAPAPAEKREVVVVGGGMAGMLAAYHLRDKKPVVIEQATQFGGNSKGEVVRGSRFSIGAAYFCEFDEDSDLDKLLTDLDLHKAMRKDAGGLVRFKGQLTEGFWNGVTDPAAAASFKEFDEKMRDIYDNDYPDLEEIGETTLTLDKISFLTWLNQNFPNLHPHVHEYLQLYCWSSFGASLSEVSAAQGLNFVSAETPGVWTLPGGNSAITQAIWQRLQSTLPGNSLRPRCLVVSIVEKTDGVHVTYENGDGKLQTVLAESCVVALPKFVAKGILQTDQEQFKAWDRIGYRSYTVSNIVLDRAIASPAYEMYCLEGSVPSDPLPLKPSTRLYTDVCYGTWAQEDKVESSVLTLYRGYPYDGARTLLFSPFAYERALEDVRQSLPELLTPFGLTAANVKHIRLARWGHAMPLARPQLLASGTHEVIRRSIGNIHFVNQDNISCPAFETCLSEAVRVAAILS